MALRGVSLKGKRDRAIMDHPALLRAAARGTLPAEGQGLQKNERRAVAHLKISCKGGKTRYVSLHPAASGAVLDYLGGRATWPKTAVPSSAQSRAITADAVYKIVRAYSKALGFEIGAHSLRATAATNALDHQADIAKVQEWLGHANIATTRIYDHRKTRSEDSPIFKVAY